MMSRLRSFARALRHLTLERADASLDDLFKWMTSNPQKIAEWESCGLDSLLAELKIEHSQDPQDIAASLWGYYSDQILFVRRLLENSEAADWVRYKLDGGIKHILLDEAQDTSPEQWGIINILAAPFFQPHPDDDPNKPRTLFAVGDEKQSIYGSRESRGTPDLLMPRGKGTRLKYWLRILPERSKTGLRMASRFLIGAKIRPGQCSRKMSSFSSGGAGRCSRRSFGNSKSMKSPLQARTA